LTARRSVWAVCGRHGTTLVGGKSPRQGEAEPKARSRAKASTTTWGLKDAPSKGLADLDDAEPANLVLQTDTAISVTREVKHAHHDRGRRAGRAGMGDLCALPGSHRSPERR
jgi:hypothetical protein